MTDHLHFTVDDMGRIDGGAVGGISIEPADNGTHHITVHALIDGELHSETFEALGLTRLETCTEPAEDADQALYTSPVLTLLPGDPREH